MPAVQPAENFRTFLCHGVLRALVLGSLILGSWSCDRKSAPDGNGDAVDRAAVDPAHIQDRPEPAAATAKVPGRELRFLSYNVENWLTMERYENRRAVGRKTKPAAEKNEVIRIMAASRPDVIGLCEIGTREDLKEIQRMMEDAGVKLPYLHHSTGADAVRALGLLSRHPIVANEVPPVLEYRLQGKTFGMGRGILDATVQADDGKLRFLGVHLKSKRPIPDGDQELMRVNEARLLRKHVDSIFQSDPKAALVVYGDFNDTFPSVTVRTITSHTDAAFRLRPVYLRDSRRQAWTHHWAPHDIYSRIDFVTVSAALRNRVDYKASHIIDDDAWDKASDHRPLMVVFR